MKGKYHLSRPASSARECGTVTKLRESFCKGRKENEGMQGLNGRGSLSFLGHEFDSSAPVTAGQLCKVPATPATQDIGDALYFWWPSKVGKHWPYELQCVGCCMSCGTCGTQ